METFNLLTGLCSVVGLIFTVAVWAYERLETKRIDELKEKGRITYTMVRL